MGPGPHQCARQLLEVVPLLMHAIRQEMRQHRARDLSVPQFRALTFVGRHAGISLSEVADHLGLSLPATSKLVDALTVRKLVRREMAENDRRRLMLTLTAGGRTDLTAMRSSAQTALARRLSLLAADEQADLQRVLVAIRPLLASPGAGAGAGAGGNGHDRTAGNGRNNGSSGNGQSNSSVKPLALSRGRRRPQTPRTPQSVRPQAQEFTP